MTERWEREMLDGVNINALVKSFERKFEEKLQAITSRRNKKTARKGRKN